MNSFAVDVFWCVAQVTLLTAVAGIVYHVGRRLGPATGAFVSLATLSLVTVITVISFSPWPNWLTTIENRWSRLSTEFTSVDAMTEPSSGSTGPSPLAIKAPTVATTESPLVSAWQGFWQEIHSPSMIAISTRTFHWTNFVAIIVLAGVLIGSLRLGAGFIAVQRYRRESQPVRDQAVLELRDVLAAQLRCTRPIEIRESDRVLGAATLGWQRPLILLPVGWRDWHEADLRSVLAHELAHIHHSDYLTWLIAQFGLVLHFYHPIAHWLCHCLRLDQELLADSVAAQLAGGRQAYLQSLAKIALEQADGQLSWPARTFLPTRRTFLRRIEMLRDSNDKWSGPAPMTVRWLAAVVLFSTGLAVTGLRDPAFIREAQAQQATPAKSATPATNSPFALVFVPRDAVWLVAFRPAASLRTAALQPLSAAITRNAEFEKSIGINPNEIETVHFFQLAPFAEPGAESVGTVIRLSSPDNAKKLANHLAPRAVKDIYGTQEYFRQEPGSFYFFGDEQTIVYAKNIAVLRRCIVASSTGASTAKWARDWQGVAGSDAAVLLNTAALRPIMAATLGTAADPARIPFAAYSPLWEKSEVAVASLQVGDALSLHASSHSATEDDAKRVRDTLMAGATLARNALSQSRQAAAASRSPEGPILLGSIDIIDELLENIKIAQANTQVTVNLQAATGSTIRLFTALLPAVTAARTAARRTTSANNLKQIALAFHNFHDVNKHFPPASTYGPNQIPRSWRVEILPYLDQAALYEQYRKDEPWDSEHNKQVLAQMPAVFRDPQDEPNSTNASYFAVAGPGTVFDGSNGTPLTQILDGTSNTILVVEAKRNIPWTKPEDIPFAADKPIPKLGGWQEKGFHAALCDGSVRFLADVIDPTVLRLLITKGDGVPVPEF